MRFEAFLGRSVRGFWATSYSFDLKLFDQYLLRRLAQSPLNAVVLVDRDKLSSVWEHLHEDQSYLTRQAGRRYLLRGIGVQGGGAFHPKTYLFVRGNQASLLVGSGNLTRSGIDDGRETFTSFSTERQEDLASMRAWGQWMGGLVQLQADELLTERWAALRDACPWLLGSSDGSRFVTNAARPLLDEVIERLPDSVAELHVTAPFFDRDAAALGRLLSACSARKLCLYLGAGVSVHGPSLATVLRTADEVSLRRFEPPRFVHAKLIGVIASDGAGFLLSGSPNISHAALTRTQSQAGGNCEAAVIREGSADEVRGAFARSGLSLVDEALDWLDHLEFDDDHPGAAGAVVLRSARWRADGHVVLDWTTDQLAAGTTLCWEGAPAAVEVRPDGASAEPLDAAAPIPLIVWLADAASQQLSNRVVIDDPDALRETLAGAAARRSSRPAELEGVEMAPLVRLALWAHDKLIFDPDETSAFKRAQEAAGEDATAEDAGDFWERYASEELQYDPRVQSYKPLTAGGLGSQPIDELLRELEMLLHAAPGTGATRLLRVLTVGGGGGEEGESHGTGTPWTMEARQRIRAYHLLMRWATAVSDPRHTLIAAQAPVVNYETLLAILFVAWVEDALAVAQLRKLLLTLLNAFVGPAAGHGFLGQVDDDERGAVLAALDQRFAEIAASLLYAALTEPGWRDDIYEWQPVLRRTIELGVAVPGSLSGPSVLHLTGDPTDDAAIGQLLARRVDWVDEATWCRRLTTELELTSLRLDRFNPPRFPIVAMVGGVAEPASDTRLLSVARRVLDFKSLQAVVVRVADDTFVLEPGAHARARVGGRTYKTDDAVDGARLREIEDQGGSWADLLGIDTGTAEAA